ncbi:MAG: response regulator transcription factor [Clostridia bacterium]|nr:response regulator transcription factor [Clostridia bacterium]
MRMKIALCDDDARALPVISGAARSAFSAKGVDPDIREFSSGRELLTALETTHFQLLLLDIEMPGIDGITLGKKLRAMGDDTKIVYVSEAESRVFEAFQVQPLGFVRKSNFLNDITAVVELYLKISSTEDSGGYLELSVRSGIVSVKSSTVRYIEGSRNYQLLYMEGRQEPVEVKMTMEKLEQMTEPCGYIRVHKGFLVNYLFIHRVTATEITLTDGTVIPIGRSKAGEVKAKYLALIGG